MDKELNPDIEITPEMVAAGAFAVSSEIGTTGDVIPGGFFAGELAVKVFRAMSAAGMLFPRCRDVTDYGPCPVCEDAN